MLSFHSQSSIRLRVAADSVRRALRLVARHARVGVRALRSVTIGTASAAGRAEVKRLAAALEISEGARPALKRVAPDDIATDGVPLRLFTLESGNGNVTLLELAVLCRLVKVHAPRVIFEIGTFDGRTTLNLAANAPADAVIHTLDLPRNEPTAYALASADYMFVDKPASGARLQGSGFEHRVTQHYGDSATFDFRPFEADFVFVDGSHAYEYVISDSLRALEMTGDRPSVIVWHDYGGWDGVTRALNELEESDERFRGLQWVAGTSLAVLIR